MRKTIAGGFDENALFFDAGYDNCCFFGSCTNEWSPFHDGTAHHMKFQNLKREKLVPAEGDHSPGITILHVDPQTGAAQLMIRSPKRIITRQNIGTQPTKRTPLSAAPSS